MANSAGSKKTREKSHRSQNVARQAYGLLFGLTAIYIYGLLRAPIPANDYHLSNVSFRLLDLSLALIIIVIWYIGVFGAVRFKQYAMSIMEYEDGSALNIVANGLMLLSFGLVITSDFGELRAFQPVGMHAYRALTIEMNYLSMLLLATVFVIIYVGALRLLATLKSNLAVTVVTKRLYAGLLVNILSAIYLAALFTDTYRSSTTDATKHPSFFLNDTWLLFTLAIPTVLTWMIGSQAIVSLYAYQQNVAGTTYRKIFRLLMIGLGIVLSFYIVLTVLTSLSQLLVGASLQTVLIFLYIVLAVYAAGFVAIAQGARKLKQLEEV